ncbi:hypothetical protein MCAMS1_00050 [biofilm metagenome]
MPASSTKPSAQHYEQASHWVSHLYGGDCSPETQQGFQEWLAINPLHQQAYQEVEAFWQQMGDLETLAQPQVAAARAYARNKQAKRHWQTRHSLALAASVLLVVMCVPLVQLGLDNGNYRTAKGEQAHIQLSDGSRIDLNTDSEIQVAYTFFNRKVELKQGEALFTVKHDAGKPFEVAAANGFIRDIGTQFNVYKQGDKVAVTMLEGEVSIHQDKLSTSQTLTAGMQYTFNSEGQNQLTNASHVKDVAAWREGLIVFKGERLGVVLEQLSRYHTIKLSTGNSKLAALKVSGSFPAHDLNLALNTMATSLPIKVNRQRDGTIVLIPTGNR